MIDDQELNRIVDMTDSYLSLQTSKENIFNFKSLFSKEYFQILDDGKYIDIIIKTL